MRTLPDGFNGAIMAVESIEDAAVFLHGPGGCRVQHMVRSTAVYPRLAPGSQEDYFDSINHFSRNVYYKIAGEIAKYINEFI